MPVVVSALQRMVALRSAEPLASSATSASPSSSSPSVSTSQDKQSSSCSNASSISTSQNQQPTTSSTLAPSQERSGREEGEAEGKPHGDGASATNRKETLPKSNGSGSSTSSSAGMSRSDGRVSVPAVWDPSLAMDVFFKDLVKDPMSQVGERLVQVGDGLLCYGIHV